MLNKKLKPEEMQGNIESSTLEYKLCRHELSKDLWETVSAFSNEGGGTILLGYDETGGKYVPVGVSNPPKILDEFTSLVGQKFNFHPLVSAEVREDDGKPIILIAVKEAPKHEKPIYIKDAGPIKGGFKRLGATDIRLSDSDVERYYQDRAGTPDSRPVLDTGLKDIDKRALSTVRNLRKLIKPDAPELLFNDSELLKAYHLLAPDSKTLNVAGVLLFGQEMVVKRHFPAMRLDIIRIKGTEWGKDRDPFLSRDLRGNLLNLWSSALDLLDRFFLVPFKLDERMMRSEETAHRKALREALTNLLMHQNYFHYSPAQVRVYNDRVEFYNPGHSLKDPSLYGSPGSELRNPLVAAVFYDIGWAEAKGTGIKTTSEGLQKEGYPLQEYSNDIKSDTFTVILPNPAEYLIPQVAPKADIYAEEHLRSIGLSERQIKAVTYVRANGRITNKEFRELVGITDRTALRALTVICEKGIFQKVGTTGRKTEYVLTRQESAKPDINPTQTRHIVKGRGSNG